MAQLPPFPGPSLSTKHVSPPFLQIQCLVTCRHTCFLKQQALLTVVLTVAVGQHKCMSVVTIIAALSS